MPLVLYLPFTKIGEGEGFVEEQLLEKEVQADSGGGTALGDVGTEMRRIDD